MYYHCLSCVFWGLRAATRLVRVIRIWVTPRKRASTPLPLPLGSVPPLPLITPPPSPFTPALRPASRAPLHPRLRPRACSPTELLPLPGHGLRALPVLRERLGNHHGHAGGRHDRGDGVSELRGAGRHDLPHVQWVGAAAEVSRPPRVRRQRLRGLPLSAEEAPGSPTHRRGGGGGQPTLASLSLSLSRPTTPRHGMPRR